jgi:hypothetical protein
MKKILVSCSYTVLLLLLVFSTVSAEVGWSNIKGEVTAIDGTLVSVLTNKDEVYNIYVPEDFDLSTLSIGDTVLAKAELLEDDTWQALSFKILGKPDSEEEDDDDDMDTEETDELIPAFCDPEKKDTPHPLAVKIAEQYEVEEEWVMQHYCSGHSMGAIKLALRTSMIEGVEVDADTLLQMHADGTGWGEIWQELEISGNQKEGRIPPGQLAKKNSNKFKEKDN